LWQYDRLLIEEAKELVANLTKVIGICRICGERRPLTKEHIPPRGVFKGLPYNVEVLSGDAVITGGKGRTFQSGFHARVLCERCNNLTGGLYGIEFARWSKWGISILRETAEGLGNVEQYEGFPLRIAKQVVSTMLASSTEDFGNARPDLREFVLIRDLSLPPNAIQLGLYLCPTRTGRSTGVATAAKVGHPPHVLIEFALPPFGYVMTLAGEPLDDRPIDISWFASRGYNDREVFPIQSIPVLPTHEAFPGDYRSKDEIRLDVLTNILTEQQHPNPREEARRLMVSGDGPAFFEANGEEWE
jgi:hypothetical protein